MPTLPPILFDRKLKQQQRNRASNLLLYNDFLIKEASERIAERLEEIQVKLPLALDLGCRHGYLIKRLQGIAGISRFIACDLSPAMLQPIKTNKRVVADPELLPFATGSIHLVVSALNLHQVNDLPGTLIQIRHILKEKGLFIASLFGGETLKELREIMMEVETELKGGASPRIIPFTEVKDAGQLLQRAGFALPVADSDTITVRYKNAFDVWKDLRAMGETNMLTKRSKRYVGKQFFPTVAERYHKRFANPEGLIPATFEIITLTGWKS